jgi:TP901 family phage tail tape measure protein
MAEIKGEQIIEKNALDQHIGEVKKLEDVYKRLATQIKKSGEAIKASITFNQGKTALDIEALNKALIESSALKNKAIKTDSELLKIEQQKSILDQQKLKTDQQLSKSQIEKEKLAQQRINTETKAINLQRKQERETQKQITLEAKRRKELDKQRGTLNKLNIENKKLREERGRLDLATRKGRRRLSRLNRTLDRNNKFIERNTDLLGRQRLGIGRYEIAARKLIGVLRQLGLGFGVFEIIRNVFNTVKDFDTALSSLGAVSGKTAKELEPLKEQALELGKTTQFTASQITGLQVELAKLGFTIDEIQKSTRSISAFATATGVAIPEAAKLAGSALRAFNLEASEMDRVTSVLGVSTTKTALDFSFLQTALSTVAPVAATFGFTIEDTTALLGQLANSGFDASSAATATRNILLNLADSSGDLAKALGGPVRNLSELSAGLIQLDESGINLAETLELTDKRSVAAFNTFIKGADSLSGLRSSITDVSGELQEMSDKRLDSVKGATDLLISAWQGLILEWNEGEGVGEGVKDTLRFLTENLKTIVSVLLNAVKVFGVYKLTTIAVTLATKAYTSAQLLATNGLRAFNVAAKANVFGLIASAIALLIPSIIELVEGFFGAENAINKVKREVKDLTNAERDLVEINKSVNEKLGEESLELESVFEALKNTTAGTEQRQRVLDNVNSKYGLTLENLSNELDFVTQLDNAYESLVESLEKSITAEIIRGEATKLVKQRRLLQDELNELVDSGGDPFASGAINPETGFKFRSNENEIQGQIDDLTSRIRNLASEVDFNIIPENETVDSPRNKSKQDSIKKTKTQIELDKQRFKDIQDNNAENLKFLETQLLNSGTKQEEIDRALSGRKVEIRKIEARESLNIFGEFSKEYIDANLALSKALSNIEVEESDSRLEDLISQNEENLEILENNLLLRGLSRKKIEIKLREKRLEDLKEENDLALEIFGEYSEEYLKANLALNRALSDDQNRSEQERIDFLDNLREKTLQVISDITKFAIDKLNERIKKNQEEIESSETEIERLKFLNTENAGEAIKAEKQRIAKEKLEIEALEKKKRNLLIQTVALERAGQLIANGDNAPFTTAGIKISEFIKNLPKFYEGTETTLGEALGRTGTRDGHIIRADDGEAIVSGDKVKALNSVGLNTTTEMVTAAMRFQNGEVSRNAMKIVKSPNSNLDMIKELKANTEAVKKIRIVQQHIDLVNMQEKIVDGNKVKNISYSPPRLQM